MSIKDRKKDHIQLTINDKTQYDLKSGFEEYYFDHNALPEVNIEEVSTKADLCGRQFSMPLFLSSMTGGHADSVSVNEVIAEVAQEMDLPFGVGSQRAMLEDPGLTETFSVARKKAPSAFIASNIGGVQLTEGFSDASIRSMIESVEADAVIVHLNPLQELMQPEGDHDFRGVLNGIERLAAKIDLPLIVKETGAGISAQVARKLLNAGAAVIDIAGAGGTSWAKVENLRDVNPKPEHIFDNWGIPTVVCLDEISKLNWERSFQIIASGGIRNSSDIVKALCLGSHFTASAQPLIKAIHENGAEGLMSLLQTWKYQIKIHLTLLGCTTVKELSRSHLRRLGS
ncbi:type 2 isopentenyl-diphosphate Delta-isomerase [Balneola sp. MJW-20]|uniref:type 2 isopentenyl-diphosphate Delta-isomerase n=1 Tax=Gracilimonas aurantiaca TaxID=3234185 RepID=UPI003465DC6D